MSAGIVLVLRFLAAAALYAFLFFSLWSLWRALRQQALLLTGQHTPPIALIRLLEDGREIFQRFDTPEVVIGRHPSCECQLLDDSVSSYHARLRYHHRHWWLEDLGSTNGTYLNGHRINVPTILVNGDEIRCGESRLRVSVSGPEHSPAEDAPHERE